MTADGIEPTFWAELGDGQCLTIDLLTSQIDDAVCPGELASVHVADADPRVRRCC